MKTRVTIFSVILLAIAVLVAGVSAEGDTEVKSEAVTQDSAKIEQPAPEAKLVVYYFHGTRRCATCKKLESYTQEAVETGFADKLESGVIRWLPVNTDDEGNEHFIEDYELYTKSVVLSKRDEGKEVEWKNLDKIWQLVRGDKEEYVKYIQDEVKAFLQES